MKKTYSAPTITLKRFALENIVTDSVATAAQVEDIQSQMNALNDGKDTLTRIVSFKEWN